MLKIISIIRTWKWCKSKFGIINIIYSNKRSEVNGGIEITRKKKRKTILWGNVLIYLKLHWVQSFLSNIEKVT